MFNANEIDAYYNKTLADGTEKTVNEKTSKDGVTVIVTAMPVETFDFL